MSRRPSLFARLAFARLALRPLALALLTSGAAAHAQSLQELYEAARAYDATYLSARALADSAQYRLAQARGTRLPTVNLTAGTTYSDVNPPSGVSLTNPRGDRRESATTSVAVTGRHPLYNRTLDATIAQAEKQFELSAADLEAAEQDLIIRLAQSYFDVLAAQDALNTARSGKTAITEQLASAKRNFEVGTATITDTREAQARFDLATAQELAAENDLLTRRIQLDQLVGRASVQPTGLAVPVTLPPITPADVEQWVQAADALQPAVRRARLALDIAQLETERARAGHHPTLDVNASVGPQYQSGSGAQLPGTTTSASIGLQLNMPLFAGYTVQNRVKETLVLEDRARNDLEAARRTVAQATRQAFYGTQSLQAQVLALEAAEASSKLALEATQLGYRVGVRVNLDVLNAQSQLFQTQRDLAAARYQVVMSNLRLRQASGQLAPSDVAAIGSLLAR
jgi:outer membrane protein